MAWLFAKPDAFLLMMMFYMAGMVVIAATAPPDSSGLLGKIKTGWEFSKKIVYALAIGGLVTGTLFAFSYKSEYEDAAKQSIITMATSSLGGMNLSSSAMEDIIKSSVTRGDVEDILEAQLGDYFNSMPDEQREAVINETYEQYIVYLSQSMGSQMNSSALGSLQSKLSANVLTQVIESVPMIKAFFDYLPLLVGFTIFTTILIFGEILVVPMTALLSLMIPSKKQAVQEKQGKQLPSADEFSGMPFGCQERKRYEERETDKKKVI
jgi:hypothetical protein